MDHYDAIIIGSGQAGNPLAKAFAKAGRKTALIERAYIGGTCINYGCTPTKTMFNSARVAYLARRSTDYGVHHGKLTVNMREVRERKQRVVEEFRENGLKGIKQTRDLDLIKGNARFIGPHEIEVQLKDGPVRSLTAAKIFINTGGRPVTPQLEGLATVPALDSTSIMELDELPEHLLVLGGGYIGLEFGQMFRRFGSRVTIVQSAAQLLAGEDKDVAEAVLSILREDGIEVFLNSRAVAVAKSDNQTKLTLREAGKERDSTAGDDNVRAITGTHLLVATGRVPNTESLKTAVGGIAVDKHGFIQVNDRLETSASGVFALGDIKGGPAFTHISYDDFRIIRTNLIEKGNASVKDRLVPYTLFIDPQLGRVGMSETEARAAGRKIRVAKMPMSYVARALEIDESRGFMKVVVDAESSQMLGAAILGIEGGEIMSQIQLAMMGKLPYSVLKDAVFAHPTLAESLNNLFSHFQD